MDTTRPSLLLRVRNPADGAAWRTFDQIYRPLLVRYAQRRGLSHSDAEDVAQDCLEAIARHIGSFNYDPGRGRFKSWLKAVVNNRVRNLARKRQEHEAESGLIERADSPEPAPDAAFDQVWMEQHLWHCIRRLQTEVDDATYRAFVAYVIEDRPVEEVCRDTGLTAGNLYTIKWRLTQRIAGSMRELTHDDED